MRWLWFGILAAILFGLWGLFDKLSGALSPFTSNLILYTSALIVTLIMLVFSKKIKFTKYAFLSGIFAGMGNFFILYSLLKNKLILVFPFVSLAGAVSFLIIWIFEKPKYNQKQKIFAVIGLILCFLGILLVATGSEGLLNFVKELAISPLYLLFSLFVLIGFTLWIFLTYKSVSKEDISSENSTFLSVLGSFVVAVLSVLILNYSSITSFQFFNIRSYIYPILAGICVAFGILLTFSAFKGTTTKSKLQEAIVAILANAELIPLLFLSYFILHEWVWEGFVGTIIVLAGLFSLHFAEMIKK